MAAPVRRDFIDHKKGSLERGHVDYIGERRVMVVEKQPGKSCYHVALQSRDDYDSGYLAQHTGRCIPKAGVQKLLKRFFK